MWHGFIQKTGITVTKKLRPPSNKGDPPTMDIKHNGNTQAHSIVSRKGTVTFCNTVVNSIGVYKTQHEGLRHRSSGLPLSMFH